MLIAASLAHGTAWAYCDEAEGVVSATDSRSSASELADARRQLAGLAQEAVRASANARGAAHGLLAAHGDLAQVQAGRRPRWAIDSSLGIGQSRIAHDTGAASRTGSARLNVSAPIYDGGRIDALERYRRGLVAASENNTQHVRERATLETVLTVIDRNRYRQQLRIQVQQVAKLSCLARSVETIVSTDRGRASELTQARKSLRQAEIQRDETHALLRQTDERLRLLVAGQVAPWGGIGLPLAELPELATLLGQIGQSPEVLALRRRAEAQEQLARASAAEGSPQLRWQVGAESGRQQQASTSAWNAGVAVSWVLGDGGAIDAATSAAIERAKEAHAALDAAIDERSRQVSVQHDAARSAYARAAHYAEVIKDSDALRNATFEQWSKLGRRSLFDLVAAESEHVQLRLAHVDALHDGQAAVAQARNASLGLLPWVAPELLVTSSR